MRNKKTKRLKEFARYLNVRENNTVCVINTEIYYCKKKKVCFIKKHVYKLLKLNIII